MTDTPGTKHCPNCACASPQTGEDSGGMRTARVKELLRHNNPPLDEEISAFRKIVEDMRATIEDLDSKIVQSQKSLKSLYTARRQAQSRLEDAKSLLHPIRSIPNELLAEICGHCVSKSYNAGYRDPDDPKVVDALDPKGGPWLLSKVCHRWRELAVNTPQLWTHLFIIFDAHKRHITKRQCAYKTGLFIQRSRGLPMTIYLDSEESIKEHPALPALEVSIPQWRYLEAYLPQRSLQSLSGNNFASLQRLRLRLHIDTPNLHVDVFQPMWAPVLREFEPLNIWGDLEHVALPWPRLLSVTRFPAFDVKALKCLRIMAELSDLDVEATSNARTPISDVISLPKLRRLRISENRNGLGSSKAFFSALVIPGLSELTLQYDRTSVLHFPAAPLPLWNLLKLDITCEMRSHEENTQHFLDFLMLTPRVEWLRLDDDKVTLRFLDGLNLDKRTDGSPAILPCLRFLDIQDCDFDWASEEIDPVYDMIYSRVPVAPEESEKYREEIYAGGDSALTNDSGIDLCPTPGLNSEGHCRCLKTVRLSPWQYHDTRFETPDIFTRLTARVKIECGLSTPINGHDSRSLGILQSL